MTSLVCLEKVDVMVGFSHIFLGNVSDLECIEEAENDEKDDVDAVADHQEVNLVGNCSQVETKFIIKTVSCMLHHATITTFLQI